MRHRLRSADLLSFLVLAAAAVPAVAAGEEWPQWLGPHRNGIAAAPPLAHRWPDGAPPLLWSREVGDGFSAPIIAGGKVILFHRLGDEDVVEAMDAESGEVLWSHRQPTAYRDQYGFNDGPRATPAAAGGRLFTYGAGGVLSALDLATGKLLWSTDTHTAFDVRQGFFGAASSPLVEAGKIWINVGGPEGAGIVAFDAASGEVAWKETDHEASYSSPVAADLGGRRLVLFFTREGLVALDPESGQVQATFAHRGESRLTVNAATPVVAGDRVFISASYFVGGALLELGTEAPAVVWSNRLSLNNHYATSILHEGHLYGYHGRQEARPALRCVRLEDGEVLWSQERFGAGSLLLAGDTLVILREDGQLVLAPASHDGFKVIAEARILGPTVRAYPAFAGGILYARDEHTLIAADLRRPSAESKPAESKPAESKPAESKQKDADAAGEPSREDAKASSNQDIERPPTAAILPAAGAVESLSAPPLHP